MNNAADVLFLAYAALAAGSALAVVISQNVVRMAFWLIMSLGATAGLFFLLNADFVGTTQLLIYVGGTLVLLIFGVMLTASGPFVRMKTGPGEGVLAGFVGLALFVLLASTVTSVPWTRLGPGLSDTGYNAPSEGNTVRPLGMALLGLRPDQSLAAAKSGGAHESQGYLLPFEVVSVHLLVVLVGAAYLARSKRAAK